LIIENTKAVDLLEVIAGTKDNIKKLLSSGQRLEVVKSIIFKEGGEFEGYCASVYFRPESSRPNLSFTYQLHELGLEEDMEM